MFPADGLNREGDMANPGIDNYVTKDTLRSRAVEVSAEVERHAMPFCPGCRKYHREGHQFCENYPQTPAEILERQGNTANTDANNLRTIPRLLILEEREKEYGSFEKVAAVSVNLKTAFTGDNFASINPTYIQVEAINMILTKLARIRQNPGHKDSWLDIKGYAELVLESLK